MGFITSIIQRYALWGGIIATIGGAILLIGKISDHNNNLETEAEIVEILETCRMTHKVSKRRSEYMIVPCVAVKIFEARDTSINWTVREDPGARIAFVTAAGNPIQAEAQLSTLNIDTASIGQKIQVLYPADNPTNITAPLTLMLVFEYLAIIAAGALLILLWLFVRRRQTH